MNVREDNNTTMEFKMKHIVSDHALAIGSPFIREVNGVENELQMYECGNTGIVFALDCAWLNDECDHAETMEIPLAIPSFVDEGNAIVLVDTEDEIDLNLKVVGKDHSDELIDSTLDKIKEDISNGDLTAIAELLHFLPEECLKNYIG
jgi:hypothetical protein